MKLILTLLFISIFTFNVKSQIDTIEVKYFKDKFERKEVKEKKAIYCLIKYKDGDTLKTSFYIIETNHIVYQKCFFGKEPVGVWYMYDYMNDYSIQVIYGFSKINELIEYHYSNDSIVSDMTNFTIASLRNNNSIELNKYILENFYFPDMAREYGHHGQVNVQFLINSEGDITEIRIESKAGEYIDAAIVEAISKMEMNPATKNGIKIPMVGYLEFNFQLRQ